MSFSLLMVIHPFFSTGEMLLPPLTLARTSALFKKSGWKKVDYLDFRLDSDCQEIIGPEIKPLLTYHRLFISELYELPLIITLLEKYRKKEDLTKISEKENDLIKTWALERGILPGKAVNFLKNTISFVLKRINIFTDYQIIVFVIDPQNSYISLLNALILKQANPKVKIFFSQKDFFENESSRKLFTLAGFSDCFLGFSEKEIFKLTNISDLFSETIESESFFLDLEKYHKKSLPIKIKKEAKDKKNELREPAEIIKDLAEFNQKFVKNNFYLYDLPLNYSQDWFENFCSVLGKQKKHFNWFGNFNPQLAEKEILLAKQTGLNSIRLDYDSSTEQINLSDLAKIIELLVKEQIYTRFNLIVGCPGETENDFYKKTEFLQVLLEKLKNSSQKKYFQLVVNNFQLKKSFNESCYFEQKGIKLNTWEKENYAFPEPYQEFCQKISCSLEIENITIGEIWQRLFFLRQMKNLG